MRWSCSGPGSTSGDRHRHDREGQRLPRHGGEHPAPEDQFTRWRSEYENPPTSWAFLAASLAGECMFSNSRTAPPAGTWSPRPRWPRSWRASGARTGVLILHGQAARGRIAGVPAARRRGRIPRPRPDGARGPDRGQPDHAALPGRADPQGGQEPKSWPWRTPWRHTRRSAARMSSRSWTIPAARWLDGRVYADESFLDSLQRLPPGGGPRAPRSQHGCATLPVPVVSYCTRHPGLAVGGRDRRGRRPARGRLHNPERGLSRGHAGRPAAWINLANGSTLAGLGVATLGGARGDAQFGPAVRRAPGTGSRVRPAPAFLPGQRHRHPRAGRLDPTSVRPSGTRRGTPPMLWPAGW